MRSEYETQQGWWLASSERRTCCSLDAPGGGLAASSRHGAAAREGWRGGRSEAGQVDTSSPAQVSGRSRLLRALSVSLLTAASMFNNEHGATPVLTRQRQVDCCRLLIRVVAMLLPAAAH